MNKLETRVKQELEEDGWTVLHRGWPDFICFKNKGKDIKAVEVKPLSGTVWFKLPDSEFHKLNPYQKIVISLLRSKIKVETHYSSDEHQVSTQIREHTSNRWSAKELEWKVRGLPKRKYLPEYEGLGVS